MIEQLIQRFLYYPTVLNPNAPIPSYASGAEEVWIDSADGNRIHALYWAAPEGRPTILFFHGNAQSVFEWALIREDFEDLDCGLLLVDYPGYGKSTGRPSEESLYAAGRGAYSWLTKQAGLSDGRIVIFGKSLGGGVASQICMENSPAGLILESTFTSVPAVTVHLFPMLPKGTKFKSEVYDTLSKMRNIHCPVLIIHGTRDELIPFAEGETLFRAASEPKDNFWVDSAGHNDVSMIAGSTYGHRLRVWTDQITNS